MQDCIPIVSFNVFLLFSDRSSSDLRLELFDVFSELLAGVLKDQVTVGEPCCISEAYQLHQFGKLLV